MSHSFKFLVMIISVLVLLSSCSQSSSTITPTIATTYTPYPTQTLIVSPTTTQTPKPSFSPTVTTKSTPTPTSTPTSSIIRYPAKQPVVIYGSEANTYETGPFLERGAFIFEPRLLLYQDGQLIIRDDESQLLEKRISNTEMDNLIFNLDQLGFFQLQETYAADIDNPLYNFPTVVPSYSNFSSGLVTVNRRDERKSIRYMSAWGQYLIQPVKNIIYYLKHYPHSEMIPYQPDRLLVGIRDGREQPTAGDSPSTPWPEGVISPLERTAFDGVLFLEGEEAAKVFAAAKGKIFQVFNYRGSEYSVFLRPIYPHECITRDYYPNNSDTQSQPFFICEDWDN